MNASVEKERQEELNLLQTDLHLNHQLEPLKMPFDGVSA
jgi:hypothetical protein